MIRYVQSKYGANRVAQIITHGKLQARAVLRDVGRVLQIPYGQVDRLCKLVPNNPANPVTLRQAIDGEPKLQEERDREPIVARLLGDRRKARGALPPRLDACRRHRHRRPPARGAGAALPRSRSRRCPITQFNWKMVEAAGLVKFDFLGLKTLTVLEKAVELVQPRTRHRRRSRNAAAR